METMRLIAYFCTGRWYLPNSKKLFVFRVKTSQYEIALKHVTEKNVDVPDRVICVTSGKKCNRAKKKSLRNEILLGDKIPKWDLVVIRSHSSL
jgi:hypothetical protein